MMIFHYDIPLSRVVFDYFFDVWIPHARFSIWPSYNSPSRMPVWDDDDTLGWGLRRFCKWWAEQAAPLLSIWLTFTATSFLIFLYGRGQRLSLVMRFPEDEESTIQMLSRMSTQFIMWR
jgi:hypothetical protein